MLSAGVPTQGEPIGVMLAEYVEGRALIRAMEGGEGSARADTARHDAIRRWSRRQQPSA